MSLKEWVNDHSVLGNDPIFKGHGDSRYLDPPGQGFGPGAKKEVLNHQPTAPLVIRLAAHKQRIHRDDSA